MNKSCLLLILSFFYFFNPGLSVGKGIKDIIIFADTALANLQPGSSFRIAFSSVKKNGKPTNPKGLKGKKNYNQYLVNVEGGIFDDGKIYINSDPRTIQDHQVKIHVSSVKQPEIQKTCFIRLYYKGETHLNFDGLNGGASKDRGKMIIPVIANEGRSGIPGQNGKNIVVRVWLYKDSILNTSLLKGEVSELFNPDNKTYFAVNTHEGTVRITANGGWGGDGGTGAEGKDGKDRSDKPGKSGGDGSDGGNGGPGGRGGNGGTIVLFIDPSAKDYAHLIFLENLGGPGGRGGAGGRGGEGGKGGTGASNGRRGSDGESGYAGENGADGPYPEIKYERVEATW